MSFLNKWLGFNKAPSAPLPNSVAKSPLFKLPPELRNMIWEYATYEEHVGPGECIVSTANGVPEPALTRTCKIIREESLGMYFNINEVVLIIKDFNVDAALFLARKLRDLMDRDNVHVPQYYFSQTGQRNWHNLKNWLKMTHASKVRGMLGTLDPVETVPDEWRVIFGLFNTVALMDSKPWAEIEPTLEHLRYGLIAYDSDWASDEVL
ncbi:hypothetical protein WHR41_04616 [Cladosporium halotolerans]|uniref:Uncharacterized protein n=1 Tax=Cladosporium halotolerans TaxID=1052096 RepID=A0AB34KTR1_9PEZI